MPAIDAIIALIVSTFLTFATAVLMYFAFVLSPRQDLDAGGRSEESAGSRIQTTAGDVSESPETAA